MSLEIEVLASHLKAMVTGVKAKLFEEKQQLAGAIQLLHEVVDNQEKLNAKIEASKTSWLVAGLKEPLNIRRKAVPCPEDYRVIACDGSHIDVDRHFSVRCFLINIGIVDLQYGSKPNALLNCIPRLYYKTEEMTLNLSQGRKLPIEGQVMGLKRSVDECRALFDYVQNIDGDGPVFLLIDGSLILWGTGDQQVSELLTQEFVVNGFLRSLDDIFRLAKGKPIAVASYISYPRSTDVVNVLRLQQCPFDQVNCDNCLKDNSSKQACGLFGRLLDRDIFDALLSSEERSAIFQSRSSVVRNHYGRHSVNFFYLKLEQEIARVEIPLWVAENNELVDILHAAIIRQCKLGFGYPVALAEAHEKAVVTENDREQFWVLITKMLAEEKINLDMSAKRWSKRRKWS